MKINVIEGVWLSDFDVCSAEHLIEVSGLSDEEFDEYVKKQLSTYIKIIFKAILSYEA